MSTLRNDANVKCPFYTGHIDNLISCEGLVEKGYTRNIFPSKDSAHEYKNHYCCYGWEKCVLAQALNSKY